MELLLVEKKDEPKVNAIIVSTTDSTVAKHLTKEFDGRKIGDAGTVTVSPPQTLEFDCVSFLKNLKTKTLGQILAYSDWVTSTQSLQINSSRDSFDKERPALHDLPIGCVFVASHQIKGVGRGSNVWDSPLGCLMFTLKFQTTTKHMVFLQYIEALAMVKALKSFPACKDLDIRLKWPNDFYVNKSKVGGILHQSNSTTNTAEHFLGVGLNVSNSKPTTCINDFVTGTKLTREAILCAFLMVLEGYLPVLEREGFKPFQSDYYALWLHTDQPITLKTVGGETKTAAIKGISLETAALLAQDTQDGQMHEVWPDGNTFDFLSGLIAPKSK